MLENVLRDLLKFRLIDILDNIQDGADYILDIINCINGIDCSLEDLEYYENDNDFFNTYYYNNPFEVARACSYGDYHVADEYVKIDKWKSLCDSNLKGIESFSCDEVKAHLEKNIYKILAKIVIRLDGIEVKNSKLAYMLTALNVMVITKKNR
ncbi:hypothetical protein [Fusobacterium sp.]|uniref:hypothetical protein n=1 Tax=Fusobacterium sp. TaxID=68766 RepID=UPI0026307324|nr:hypothetical protein [Fusobacterium sp.]